jgi:hypothetical protein
MAFLEIKKEAFFWGGSFLLLGVINQGRFAFEL